MKRVLFAIILTWIGMPGCAVDQPWRPIGAREPAGDLYDAIETEDHARDDLAALTEPRAMPSAAPGVGVPASLQLTTH